MFNNTDKTVFVMLSGGVDSSVSALDLKLSGINITGVYMKCWSLDQITKLNVNPELYACQWEDDLQDAKLVAKKLGVNFEVWDFQEAYLERVVNYMLEEYLAGRTPNPDVMCNSQIKFGIFLKKALELGAYRVASGHYARLEKVSESYLKKIGVLPKKSFLGIFRGRDIHKDQSYFLWKIKSSVLQKALFPIGKYQSKQQVRDRALEFDLITANKKDSQGLCFIGKTSLRELLKQKFGIKKGQIINLENQDLLGTHPGAFLYTIGQRSNLGLSGGPWFVAKVDVAKNIVYVKHGNQKKQISAKQILITDCNWLLQPQLDTFQCLAQVRYHQQPQDCKVEILNSKEALVSFTEPVWATALGQSLVLYLENLMLGGGVIQKVIS